MSLEQELRQLFGGTQGAPWPGERVAFERFRRRRARRGRAVAAAAGLALVAVLGAAPCWWPAGSPRTGGP
jgi:hypothetical protein